ncbi:type II secretion system secretin GspD [Alteripontixanthobacter muriae]|uniref:type II secretion system secretin GspD n=1 Tax=Alteripontixanthobacter muriae TaxID=2705546 RepID=UPI0019D5E0B9|nr:type II secretion system secretin GspD [Alteripontixanthobacter muriae]
MKIKRISRWTVSITLAMALALPGAAQQSSVATNNVVVNMRDVDIADVAQQISRITGRTIILDPSVTGTVNVTSSAPLSPAGVWELFVSVLRGQGYAVVRNGRAWRVIPQATAVREPAGGAVSGRVVTRLISLRNLEPEAAVRIFRPLIAAFGSIEAVTNPNAIVVTDYADNVARIASLAQSLDRGSQREEQSFATIDIARGSAPEIATAIEGIIGGEEGGPRVVADERANVVLVRGTLSEIAEARRIADTLDKINGEASITRVIRLRYNDAETVAAIVGGLIGGDRRANNPVASTLGTIGDNRLVSGAVPVQETVSAVGGLPALGQTAGFPTAGGLRNTPIGSTVPGGVVGYSSETLSVQAAPELNAIVIRGAPSEIASIENLITELDIRRPQVMIEAAIVEITGDQSEQLGLQLGLGGAADIPLNSGGTSFTNLGLSLRQALAIVGAPAAGALAVSGLSAALGSRGDFALLVQALGQSTRANLLSTPSITTLDNKPAEIVVGQNVPFRTGAFVSEGINVTPFTTIERADVGITLRVVPRIHEGDTVRLEVSQEVSSLVGSVVGAADIITNRRSIQTTVMADNEQTIVLGGLISDDQIETRSQVPILGDIPVIGELFRSRQEQKTRRTLFVFLKPTILRDPQAVRAAAGERYDQVRAAETLLEYDTDSLLIDPPEARLPLEIDGVY